MMFKRVPAFILFCILFVLQSCFFDDRSKESHYSTTTVCDKLYVETFTIFGGAGGGDRVSAYLTDSTNFRIYVGAYVQGYGFYSYKCHGDTVRIFKVTEKENQARSKDSNDYSLSHLKKERRLQ